MNFPFIMVRLWPAYHREKTLLNELLDLLRRYPGACDEVWLCSDLGFPDLSVHAESATLMAEAAQELRQIGVLPGMQIANTIGHGDGLSFAKGPVHATWQRLVGHDGLVSTECNCPRDEKFLVYQRDMAALYAAAVNPSSIWIDDDLRMYMHSPVSNGCFCEKCLADFSREQGRSWTRPELVAQLSLRNQHNPLRLAWIKFGMSSLADVAAAITAGVTAHAPNCRMGMQHGALDWSTHFGPDLTAIFAAMTTAGASKLGSRPGHGYYTDHAPREMLTKCFSIARQVERIGRDVEQLCPEVENFVHTSGGKSVYGTALESTMHLAMGCNSLSYALLTDFHHEPAAYLERYLQTFAAWRPHWERMVEFDHASCLGGLNIVFGRQHAAMAVSDQQDAWSQWGPVDFIGQAGQLATLGLPLCADSPQACATLLTKEAAEGLTTEELRELFSHGVLLDGETLGLLQRRNLGFDLGAKAEKVTVEGYELFTPDPLNGMNAQQRWWNPIAAKFCHRLTFSQADQARVLGEFITVSDQRNLGPTTAVIENELGGRMGILGHSGLHNVLSSAKRSQLLSISNWISGGRLPALIETASQVVLCPKLDRATGRLRSVTLLNASIGKSPDLVLRLNTTNVRHVVLRHPERAAQALSFQEDGASHTVVQVPSLAPWSAVFLEIE